MAESGDRGCQEEVISLREIIIYDNGSKRNNSVIGILKLFSCFELCCPVLIAEGEIEDVQ